MIRPMFAAVLLAAATLAAPAFAQSPPEPIQVVRPWARATAPNARAGGAFMTITNRVAADRLVSASSPVAASVEVHRTVEENGVMKMLAVPALDLPTGQTVTLAPGGYHIMLMGLKQQLKAGESFPMTLTFAKAPAMTVTVTVEAAGAAAAGGHGAHGAHGAPPKP